MDLQKYQGFYSFFIPKHDDEQNKEYLASVESRVSSVKKIQVYFST